MDEFAHEAIQGSQHMFSRQSYRLSLVATLESFANPAVIMAGVFNVIAIRQGLVTEVSDLIVKSLQHVLQPLMSRRFSRHIVKAGVQFLISEDSGRI